MKNLTGLLISGALAASPFAVAYAQETGIIDEASAPVPEKSEPAAIPVPPVDLNAGPRAVFDRWAPFYAGDYPAEAYANKQEGTVFYQIQVDAKGAASDCKVIEGSGIAVLDDATCPALMRVAAFEPALDAAGKPIASIFEGVADWEIKEPEFQNMVIDVQYRATKEGKHTDCVVNTATGGLPDNFQNQPCPKATSKAAYRNEQGIPVDRDVRLKFVVEVTDPSSDTTTDPAN